MYQPYCRRHCYAVIHDHDTYDLAHGPAAYTVKPRPGALPVKDTIPEGPRHTCDRKQTINNLITATTRMRGLDVEQANHIYNPSGDPAVKDLIRRLLTPGRHLCGRQVMR
jgi:hypothetical protein